MPPKHEPIRLPMCSCCLMSSLYVDVRIMEKFGSIRAWQQTMSVCGHDWLHAPWTTPYDTMVLKSRSCLRIGKKKKKLVYIATEIMARIFLSSILHPLSASRSLSSIIQALLFLFQNEVPQWPFSHPGHLGQWSGSYRDCDSPTCQWPVRRQRQCQSSNWQRAPPHWSPLGSYLRGIRRRCFCLKRPVQSVWSGLCVQDRAIKSTCGCNFEFETDMGVAGSG